jgi:hypothetical protein
MGAKTLDRAERQCYDDEERRRVAMVKVEIEIRGTNGAPSGWWAEVEPALAGEGSGLRIVAKGEPRWLPRPQRSGVGTPATAWVERPAGTFIRAGGAVVGGMRHARVTSPVLVVEEGAEWYGWAKDGSRQVEVIVRNAREVGIDELPHLQAQRQEEEPNLVAILEAALAAARGGEVEKVRPLLSQAMAAIEKEAGR